MSTRVRPFTHVYIFEAGPYCKVGATSNMRQRMKDMRCYAMQYVREAPVFVAAWEVSDAGAIEAAVRSLIGPPAKGLEWYKIRKAGAVAAVRKAIKSVHGAVPRRAAKFSRVSVRAGPLARIDAMLARVNAEAQARSAVYNQLKFDEIEKLRAKGMRARSK